jgi:hypothetical protein
MSTVFRTPWLPRIIIWLLQFDKRAEYETNVQIDEYAQEELPSSVNRLETLYVAVQNSFRESHKVNTCQSYELERII